MKLSTAKHHVKAIPFHKDDKLAIFVKQDGHRITEFSCSYKNNQKLFKVVGGDLLSAWKKMEKWLEKID